MDRTFSKLVGISAASLMSAILSSCSLSVKVREEWKGSLNEPIAIENAAATWTEIRAGIVPQETKLNDYNEAVRNSVVQIARNWAAQKDRLSVVKTTAGAVNLQVNSVNVTDLHLVTEVVPADFVKIRQGLESDSKVDGVGTSLLVRQEWTETDSMIPKTGLWYPVTAVLNLDRIEAPVLELIDPTKGANLSYNGRPLPLSADYSAALARDFQDRQKQFERLNALLKFEKFADRTGLYRVSAFDPKKKVCILIHGIFSSPSTWDETINRLYQDKDIREKYEFWTFGYPTGAPIPYMAAELRDAIYEMIEFRRRRGSSHENMVVVGHSMGGLLARTLTMNSGDENWNLLFNVPIEELKVSESDREMLRRMVYFDPVPNVERVIFCATPHRGSKVAEKPGARLIGDLIQVPSQLMKLSTTIVTQSAYALTPLGMEFARERITSIDQLGYSTRSSTEFLRKPLNPAVHFHSIIGNSKGEGTPLENCTDGVVSYLSAHLDGVESEVVINGSPHGVHRTDGGIREIIRILRLP